MPIEEASQYELPFEYVRTHVKPERDKVRSKKEKEQWWIHGRPSPKMREAVQTLPRCIVTPEVGKYRIFVWVSANVNIAHRLYIFGRSDDYFFGMLHSKPHELWSLRKGGRIGVGNDPVYNLGRCFETFPFPWPPGQEPRQPAEERRSSGETFTAGDARDERRSLTRVTDGESSSDAWQKVEAIALAARELNEKRERWLHPQTSEVSETSEVSKSRTLTNLYNQRPTWLQLAHEKLDKAVCDAYGWPHDLTDEEILERLLEENLRRAG